MASELSRDDVVQLVTSMYDEHFERFGGLASRTNRYHPGRWLKIIEQFEEDADEASVKRDVFDSFQNIVEALPLFGDSGPRS